MFRHVLRMDFVRHLFLEALHYWYRPWRPGTQRIFDAFYFGKCLICLICTLDVLCALGRHAVKVSMHEKKKGHGNRK